jgi:hypothetical protein
MLPLRGTNVHPLKGKPDTMDPKLLSALESRRLVSFMNKSRWSSLVSAMLGQRCYRPQVQYKQVGREPDMGFTHFDWEAHRKGAWCEWIEWMRMDCAERAGRGKLADTKAIEHKDEIVGLLTALRIPFEDEGRYVVIYGYKDGSNRAGTGAR